MAVIKVGADPEGFIVDGKGDFISAAGLIPGNKQEPFALDGGAVQVDGMAIEFNIEAATTEDEFNGNVEKVLAQINEMVKNVDRELSIRWTPVAKFRRRIWNMAPEQSKVLGCDPDFNISGEVNTNPTHLLENNPIRTAAGHIHIGWLDHLIEEPQETNHFKMCLMIARGFYEDFPSSYRPRTVEEIIRLKYYGHSGSFRPKKYGVELRAPSNLWVPTEEGRRTIYRETRQKLNDIIGL